MKSIELEKKMILNYNYNPLEFKLYSFFAKLVIKIYLNQIRKMNKINTIKKWDNSFNY
jgi:hypothetical protein